MDKETEAALSGDWQACGSNPATRSAGIEVSMIS